MFYREKLNSLNILIKLVITLNNKLYKLVIQRCYSDASSKVRPYYRYVSY